MAPVMEVVKLSKQEANRRDRDKYQEELAESFRNGGEWRAAARVERCCRTYHGYGCSSCGDARGRAVPEHCGIRLCPHCERRRALRAYPVIARLIGEMEWPAFVTLTVANFPSIEKDRFQVLRKAFSKLRSRAFWRRNVKGGVYGFEVEYNRDRADWNVHIHLAVEAVWLEEEELARQWFQCLPEDLQEVQLAAALKAKKRFLTIVDVVRIGPKRTGEKRISAEAAAAEVAKYMTKGANFYDLPGPVVDLYLAVTRCRLVAAFGCFYGRDGEIRKALDEEREDEPLACERCGEKLLWLGPCGPESVLVDEQGKEWLQPGALEALWIRLISRESAAAGFG